MNLSERLRSLRKRHRYSQKSLADALHGTVSQSTISQIEAGVIKEPRYDTLRQIAAVFNMTVSALLEGVDEHEIKVPPDSSTNGTPGEAHGVDPKQRRILQYLRDNPSIEDILLDLLIDAEGLPVSQEDIERALRYAIAIQEEGQRLDDQRRQHS
jgi:transcriptional regulator with XRE-family HTH domain